MKQRVAGLSNELSGCRPWPALRSPGAEEHADDRSDRLTLSRKTKKRNVALAVTALPFVTVLFLPEIPLRGRDLQANMAPEEAAAR